MRRSALRLEIQPAPTSNDHEVKVWVDDRDLLSEVGVLGLDPDDLFWPTPTLLPTAFPTTTTLARCSCGVVGCADMCVRIEEEHPCILWTVEGVAGTVRFLRQDYEAEVLRAAADCSWETPDRTAARLVRASIPLVSGHLDLLGLRFEWASGRVQAGSFTVSLASVRGQVLVHVPTIGPPEALAARMLEVLREYRGP
jgi:hypothetical protein